MACGWRGFTDRDPMMSLSTFRLAQNLETQRPQTPKRTAERTVRDVAESTWSAAARIQQLHRWASNILIHSEGGTNAGNRGACSGAEALLNARQRVGFKVFKR